MTEKSGKQLPPGQKLFADLGPLVIFFIANARYDLFVATGLFMVAVIAALVFTYLRTRHIPPMPLVSAGLVIVFGGLTLYLQDETFIKMKPTILYVMFALVLAGGVRLKKPLLRSVMESALPPLHNRGWTVLSLYWAALFIVLAIANEAVWRNFSTDTWVTFKVFGLTIATFVVAIGQVPLIQKYQIDKAGD